jgi:hypothetical protein
MERGKDTLNPVRDRHIISITNYMRKKEMYSMIPALVVHLAFMCRRAGDAASRHPAAVGAGDHRDETAMAARPVLHAELALAIDLGELCGATLG